jgi:carboxymethylenebutenolidase
MNNQQDINSLLGASSFGEESNRRTFIQTAIGVGFAAAALPVCAQTMITTNSVGLSTETIDLEINGQRVPLYIARPVNKTNLPVVLVISEIFGVHEHIADVARRFAKEGYLAIAPDLFIRQGDPSKTTSVAELIKEIISKVPDAQVMQDLDAVVAWAKTNGGNVNKLAITGFCWGGRITWLYAAHNPLVKTGAAWYGGLVGKPNELKPSNPIDIAASLKAPILGLYGALDKGIPLESIEQMKLTLSKGNSHSEFKVYENSGHAFNADYRPSYVEADAKDAWINCLNWLKKYLN